MKASVDPDACIGCEQCTEQCPEVFEMDDGHSTVKVDPLPPDQEGCALEAADACPASAITVED